MKYMFLIYEDDADRVASMDERMPNCSAYAQAMIKAGIYVCGDRLRGVTTATTVRLTHGNTHWWTGPTPKPRNSSAVSTSLMCSISTLPSRGRPRGPRGRRDATQGAETIPWRLRRCARAPFARLTDRFGIDSVPSGALAQRSHASGRSMLRRAARHHHVAYTGLVCLAR